MRRLPCTEVPCCSISSKSSIPSTVSELLPLSILSSIIFRQSKHGWRSELKKIMASATYEQPAASMGRRKKGARRAQAYGTDDEGKARRETAARTSTAAGGIRRHQTAEPRRLDVFWAIERTSWDNGGDGRILIGKEEDRWAHQRYGKQEAGKIRRRGFIYGFTERKYSQGYRLENPGRSTTRNQEARASCIRSLDE